jgi:hypothetical protein
VSEGSTYDPAEARRYFSEIPFDSLTVVRTGPDKFLLIDAEGTEYRSVGFLPGPARQSIAGFTVDDDGRLHFLRRRGEDAVPGEQVVHRAERLS